MTASMKLSDLRFIELLPLFMRQDESVQALATAVDQLMSDKADRIKSLSGWTDLEGATDDELDEFAWELNIPWYESGASRETKIALIRHSYGVFAKLGTKWALESILSDYFGTVKVREWTEYLGKPYHFKILTDNPDMLGEGFDQFEWLMSLAKRKSAHVDAIDVGLTGELPLYAGMINHDCSHEINVMGMDFIPEYASVYSVERDRETVRMSFPWDLYWRQ